MNKTPLAFQLRPKQLNEYVGQKHLLDIGCSVRGLIDNKKPTNIIFWGPPGIGKTSLSYLLKESWQAEWFPINATLASISDIKKAIELAKENKRYGKQTVLFIDEVHRFSKTQQDALLSVVEDGTLFLIGATTENPRFSVIPGLVSRCFVFECKPLSDDDMFSIAAQALKASLPGVAIEQTTLLSVISLAAGDARKLCNFIELLGSHCSSKSTIEIEDVLSILPDAIRTLDDTTHYDLSSALIKSLRGSDTDASLYWLARLLESGEDPVFIARRFVIFASEDIGNADPQALILSMSGMQVVQNIGMPEARICLGQMATYLATAPKSNASYVAINAAIEKVRSGDNQPVPIGLRTRQSQAMSNEKSGEYLYPHNYPYSMVSQNYWDNSEQFYIPKPIGFEREIQKRLEWIKVQKKNQPS